PQLFAIEDLIHHATDEAGKGLVVVKAGNLFVTPASGSIQRAIDAATSGDTVNVAAGTYAENVTIGTPLTLAGGTGTAADVQIAPTTGDAVTITANGAVTVSGVEATNAVNGFVSTGSSALTFTNVAAVTNKAAGFLLAGTNKGDITLSGISATGNGGAGLNVTGFNTVNLTAPTITGNAAHSSIGGATTLNFTSTAGSTPTTVTASGSALTSGPTSGGTTNDTIDLTGLSQINLTGGSGIDTFKVTPAAGVAFNVTGGTPAGGASGDVLDLTGATIGNVTATPSAAGFSGTATSTGNGDVDFSQIENFLPAASISGTVFSDSNGNGTQDTGERGLSGQTVQVTDGTNTFTTTTDASGAFSFTGLAPGSYTVTVATPGNATVTTTPSTINATLGSTNTAKNVGFQFAPATAGTSTVSGVVFNDANSNGTQDTGEAGVNGVVVFLDLNGDGQLDNGEPSTTTSTVGGVAGSFTLTSTAVGTVATVRTVPKTGLSVISAPTVTLADNATETVNLGVSVAATIPPQLPLVGQTGVGIVNNGAASVNVYDASGTLAYSIPIAGSFPGGLRVAMGDVTGDGVPDAIVGTGPGVQASIMVFDGVSHNQIFQNNPFETFTGGVFVTTGDITGDGLADIVVTPDQGGGPRVVVIRGGDFHTTMSFFGIADPNFRGGARAAIGDMNADGFADLIVAAGFSGGPRVSLYDGAALVTGQIHNLINDFFVFPDVLRNGVFVAAGDVNGDGFDDLIVGAGPGGGPQVMVLSGQVLLNQGIAAALAAPLHNFFGGNPANRNGIHVAVKDLNGDGLADIVTGDGNSGQVTGYNGLDASQRFQFSVDSDNSAIDGIFVG
ncbi:MAG TPA: SdrD B-like domain-containing protein, partial [Gemmataceae bacterium]